MAQSIPSANKKRSRIGELIAVLVLIGIVVLAAFFQEQLTSFFTLRLWDKGAPGRTVVEFLKAGKAGNKQLADSYMADASYKPLMQNGKWTGYYLLTQAGRIDIPFAEMAPPGEPTPISTEFITIGRGAAEVTMPDSNSKPLVYRLEMKDNGWKITELRGGHPAPPPRASTAKPKSPVIPPH